jgi:murein L,D-transpeptidase YcbB/YkuD
MMRLRHLVWTALPALLVAISMLAPGLQAARTRRVKHKLTHKIAHKVRLHAAPSHRDHRHLAVRRKITHKVPSRRAHFPRERRTRFYRFRRMPASPSPDRIDQIQQALARGGFYQGDPSGRWDADTVEAMKSFQQAHGLTPTGKIDASSLHQLGLGSDVAGLAPPQPLIAADSGGPGE